MALSEYITKCFLLKNMKKLSVIIPFLNEGAEIEQTIIEIKRTAGESVDIVLVNDASTDGYDYVSIAKKYNVNYYQNRTRQGSAATRDIGIFHCKTPFFLTIDGHMRFYHDMWVDKIVSAIDNDERAIYCCRCKAWCYETGVESKINAFYGAYVGLNQYCGEGILDVNWIRQDFFQNLKIVDIPCILGACYAASRKYWQFLKGECGLKLYGCDEQNISIKTWMEGGRCRLLKDVTIGHLFRQKIPYQADIKEINHNKAFIAATLFPVEHQMMVYQLLDIDPNMLFDDKEKAIIEELKNYYQSQKIINFDRFTNINSYFINLTYKNMVQG